MALRLYWQALKFVLKAPFNFVIFAVYTLLIAIFNNSFVGSFLEDQVGKRSDLSVSSDILLPLSSFSLFCIIFLLPLWLIQLRPLRVQNGMEYLLASYPVSKRLWSIIDTSVLISIAALFHFLFIIILLPLLASSTVDWPVFISAQFGHLLTLMLVTFLLSLTFLYRCSTAIALIMSYGTIALVWSIQALSNSTVIKPFTEIINPFSLYQSLVLGIIVHQALIQFTLYIALLCSILFVLTARITTAKKSASVFVIVVGFITLNISSKTLQTRHDLTSNQRYSLQSTLQQLLAGEDVIKVATHQLDEIAQQEIALRLVEPMQDKFQIEKGSLTQQQLTSNEPGVLLTIDKDNFWLNYPFSQHPQQLLAKKILLKQQQKNNWIVFLTGHNELSIASDRERSLSVLAEMLSNQGFKLTELKLRDTTDLPANTSLIVLASPQSTFQPTEVQQLISYLERGGNLLWLRDPDDTTIKELDDYLGITRLEGTLIDPRGYSNGTPHPAILVVEPNEKHPVVASLTNIITFPWSAALVEIPSTNRWQTSPIIQSNSQTWTEFQINEANLEYNENQGELLGVFNVAWELSRRQGNKTQQVIITGDSHFVANNMINQYDNAQFANNIVRWLVLEEPSLNVLPLPIDRQVILNSTTSFMISWLLPFGLPALLIIFGIIVWRRSAV